MDAISKDGLLSTRQQFFKFAFRQLVISRELRHYFRNTMFLSVTRNPLSKGSISV